MDVFEKIKKQGLIFDGGMGSMLIGQGLVAIILQPNAGTPERTQDADVFYPENEITIANNILNIKELGVEMIAGCCEATPAYIKRNKEPLSIDCCKTK